MRNILLTVEYDGTGFHGWQIQPQVRTAQGVLQQALSRVCGRTIEVQGVSRTDAGVHALGQRAGFRGDFSIPLDRLAPATNHLLWGGKTRNSPLGDMRIVDAEEKPEGFHARYDAVGKTYLYRIQNTVCSDLFGRNTCWMVKDPLDPDRMRQAAACLVGTHDFAAFQAAGGKKQETTVRTIYSLRILERPLFPSGAPVSVTGRAASRGKELWLEVTGDGFLYNMVRILTGTLVDIGAGDRDAADMPAILTGRDRRRAGVTAPPQGLYLAKVYYDRQALLQAAGQTATQT